ncbi:MAG: hypothetical protein R3C14_28250 [Caldilineaceae bacterium]
MISLHLTSTIEMEAGATSLLLWLWGCGLPALLESYTDEQHKK